MNPSSGQSQSPVELVLRADHIAVITLNRPASLNAIDSGMTAALRIALRVVEQDESIRAVVLAANGDRAFCVGIDLKERQRMSDAEARVFREKEILPMFREFDSRAKPVIAAVFGHVIGGGFELVLCCDMVVAAEDTEFSLPELKWGLLPAVAGCRKLPGAVGPALAREMILTSCRLNASKALGAGLVNRVVPRGQELAGALELAARVAANVPSSVRAAKRCMDDAINAHAATAFDLAAIEEVYADGAARAGIDSFRR